MRDGEILLFYEKIDAFSPRVDVLRETLSEWEHARAERFRSGKDREGYVIARGLLRVILGAYTNSEPENVHILNGPHGKPMLAGRSSPDSIRFSVSHSGGRVLYAIARGWEIGVDVEKIRPDFPCGNISDRYFSSREAALIRGVSEHARTETFFSHWTLKEALLKGLGCGLSLPLNGIEIARDPPKVLSIQGHPGVSSRWTVRNIDLEPGYAAALAVEDGDHLSCGGIDFRKK